MIRIRNQLFFTLAVVTGVCAFAQSANQVPGPTDYAAFSRFVTDRNIFDSTREPHVSGRRIVSRPHSHSSSAPAFALVGTMSYGKGIFAFFSGNSADLKKALLVSEKIAGYTVTEISYGRVTLESTNQTGKLELKVGDVMRQENGKWELAGQGEVIAENGATENAGSATGNSSSASASAAPNDILKRLMEKRAKENQ
jgi:hypothetical protein